MSLSLCLALLVSAPPPTPTAASCAAAPECKMLGLCGFEVTDDRPQCRATEARHCTKSRACKRDGACSLVQGACYAGHGRATDAQLDACFDATGCKLRGLCAYEQEDPTTLGYCETWDKGCATSEVCRIAGLCKRRDAWSCGVTDCAESEACKRFGACTPSPQRQCVVDPAAWKAPACKVEIATGLVATATSAQAPWKEYTFDAKNLVDGDLTTSWQPAKGKAVGEKITLKLQKPRKVLVVAIANGFKRVDRLGDLEQQNGKLLLARVSAGGKSELLDTFADDHSDQTMFAAVETDTIELEVLLTEPGLLFDDLAISEIKVAVCAE